jgi:hypothetical protein
VLFLVLSPRPLRAPGHGGAPSAGGRGRPPRDRVEQNFKKFYRGLFKKDPPGLFWAISPRHARKIAKSLHGQENDTWYGVDFTTPGEIRRVMQSALDNLPRDPELEAALNQIRHPMDLGARRAWRLFLGTNRPDIGEHNDLRRYALIDFFVSRNTKDAPLLDSWLYVVASCNGLYFHQRGIVFLETPEIIRTDENGRLHYESGPAFRYRDGREYYFLHGVRVQKQYVFARADEISLADVLAERNAEARMAIISKIGFVKLLTSARHWTISEANGNRLIEFRVKGTQLVRALHLKWRDKTGDKETVLPVPNRRSYFGADCPDDIDDCEQVRRWTLGWPKEALAVAET